VQLVTTPLSSLLGRHLIHIHGLRLDKQNPALRYRYSALIVSSMSEAVKGENRILFMVVDPHWFNADTDTDPDPDFFLITDPVLNQGFC
jgi:hypothetical protein